MALGGASGILDTGIDDDRLRDLGSSLGPGSAALCALVAEADWPRLRDEMRPSGGELVVAELKPDAALALVRQPPQ